VVDRPIGDDELLLRRQRQPDPGGVAHLRLRFILANPHFEMKLMTLRKKGRIYIRFWLPVVFFAGLGMWGVLFFEEDLAGTLIAVGVSGTFVVLALTLMARIASEIRLGEQGIVVRTLIGRKVSVLYSDITGIRTYRAIKLGERNDIMSIKGPFLGELLLVISALDGGEELVGLFNQHATNASWRRGAPWVDKVLLGPTKPYDRR
jgi:hypothetical protein